MSKDIDQSSIDSMFMNKGIIMKSRSNNHIKKESVYHNQNLN